MLICYNYIVENEEIIMAMTRQRFKNDCIIHNTLDELVLQEHLVRKLDNCIDFIFIEELVKDLYSDLGRPSILPVVLFKLIFINMIFGINLMRRTCEECKQTYLVSLCFKS